MVRCIGTEISMKKKILFLTGTRADYGKMKPLMCAVEEQKEFECHIFITGMHTMKEFGETKTEIIQDGFENIQVYMNQIIEEPMDLILANTINGFSRYIKELLPDMIIIHGDRVEALAGAIAGALNNILVAHVEGGEISGTIDESIRHSISKLSHIHFVTNLNAKNRLLQLGENDKSIFIIGSPDIDIIMKEPSLDFGLIKNRYEIEYDSYAVLMYHPVTTENDSMKYQIQQVVDSIFESNDNYIVIHPNNDHGYGIIVEEYKRFNNYSKVKRFPSIRFEFFLEILRNANYLIGNSSAGIHEAPAIGIPSINIGSRQKNRFEYESIINCGDSKDKIMEAIKRAKNLSQITKSNYFGDGNSRDNFLKLILEKEIWEIKKQKLFNDIV